MKVIDIAQKDLIRSTRSLFALGMMLVAPFLITGSIYLAYGGLISGTGSFNLAPLQVAIANLDQPAGSELDLGQMLVDFFRDENMPDWLQTVKVKDEASAWGAVDRQEAGVAIIVPADFSQSLLEGQKTAYLLLVQDPTLSIGPQIVKDILSQFVDGVSGTNIAITIVREELSARGLEFSPAAMGEIVQAYSGWFTALSQNLHHSEHPLLVIQAPSTGLDEATQENPLQKMMGLIMTGQMLFFAFFAGGFSAQSIIQEDEEGTLPRLFTTPTPRSVILGGKFVSVFITVLLQMIVLMLVSSLLFRINWGQPLSVAMATLSTVILSTGFGLIILCFVKTTRQSGPVLGGVLTLTGMLGGLMTVNIVMPEAFYRINLFFPQGWALHAWKLVSNGAAPGMIVQFAIFGLVATSMVLLLERKTRTLQRILTTSTSRAEIIAGHLLFIFVTVFVQQLLLVIFGQFLLGVDYLRQPLSVLLLMGSFSLWIAGVGMFIGVIAKTEEQVTLFALIAMFVATALARAWFPLEGTSPAFSAIGHLTPGAYAMDGFQNIIVRGLGLSSVLPPSLVLLGYAVLFFGVALWKFRFE